MSRLQPRRKFAEGGSSFGDPSYLDDADQYLNRVRPPAPPAPAPDLFAGTPKPAVPDTSKSTTTTTTTTAGTQKPGAKKDEQQSLFGNIESPWLRALLAGGLGAGLSATGPNAGLGALGGGTLAALLSLLIKKKKPGVFSEKPDTERTGGPIREGGKMAKAKSSRTLKFQGGGVTPWGAGALPSGLGTANMTANLAPPNAQQLMQAQAQRAAQAAPLGGRGRLPGAPGLGGGWPGSPSIPPPIMAPPAGRGAPPGPVIPGAAPIAAAPPIAPPIAPPVAPPPPALAPAGPAAPLALAPGPPPNVVNPGGLNLAAPALAAAAPSLGGPGLASPTPADTANFVGGPPDAAALMGLARPSFRKGGTVAVDQGGKTKRGFRADAPPPVALKRGGKLPLTRRPKGTKVSIAVIRKGKPVSTPNPYDYEADEGTAPPVGTPGPVTPVAPSSPPPPPPPPAANLRKGGACDSKMAKGGNFIAQAIKKPGALRKQLGAKKGQPIPAAKLAAAAKKPGKLGQRARLAQTLKGFRKADGGVIKKAAGGAAKVRRGFPNTEKPPKGYAQGGQVRGTGAAKKGFSFSGVF